MPLGKKEIKAVITTGRQAQCIQAERTRLSAVNSTEIKRKGIINEYPNIVITCKTECLARLICERGM